MERLNPNLRRSALARIALLSAKEPLHHHQHAHGADTTAPLSSLERLTSQCALSPQLESSNGFANGFAKAISAAAHETANILSVRELEVLIALCDSVPVLHSKDAASKLLATLSPYVLQSTSQEIESSPYLRNFIPCPWEVLASSLTGALSALGIKFVPLRDDIVETFNTYLRGVYKQTSSRPDLTYDRDSLNMAILVVSLLGFLKSAATHVQLWTAEERVELINYIRNIMSPEFLLAVETAFSAIRNSHEPELRQWKKYTRHYAATGRPLGAALLQQGFTALLSATTALFVADTTSLKEADILDILLAEATTLRPGSGGSPMSERRELSFREIKPAPPPQSQPHKLNGDPRFRQGQVDIEMVSEFADIAAEQLAVIEDGADYMQLGSTWQQRLAFSIKAYALTAYCNCVVLFAAQPQTQEEEENEIHADNLITWLETTMEDPVQMADQELAKVVLKIMAVVARNDRSFAVNVARLLPRFVVQNGVEKDTVQVAGKCLAVVLQGLSTDAIITTLYTLGNVLSSGAPERALTSASRERLSTGNLSMHNNNNNNNMGSAISLTLNTEEEKYLVYERVIEAIVCLAANIHDEKIVALAGSILSQKIGRVNGSVDAKIILELRTLAISGGPPEMKLILKLFDRLSTVAVGERNVNITKAVLDARLYIAEQLVADTPLRETYLVSLLECIVNKGDIHEYEAKRQTEAEVRATPLDAPKLRLLGGSSMYLHLDIVQLAAREISQLLQPLAVLLANKLSEDQQYPPYAIPMNPEIQSLFRDAWFNCVVHGFLRDSELVQSQEQFLRIIARHSPPLIAESRIDQTESDMELNTVLRRGMNGQNTTEQKKKLGAALPSHESEIKGLSYSKVIFLQAALLVESLRASEGDCSRVLTYFVDPIFKHGDTANCMGSIANEVMTIYLRRVLSGTNPAFGSEHVAQQLVELMSGCCHRVEKVQTIAAICTDKIINVVPSALCHRSSLFALLELLSLLWTSCLEAETDEYAWRSLFKSSRGKVQIELSDSYALRLKTLNSFNTRAEIWVTRVLAVAPMDIRGLLQTYLANYDDEGAFGHISRGRSFAYQVGAQVPSSDHRLASIDHLGDCDNNIASDFMAQYTIRQAYRFEDHVGEQHPEWLEFLNCDENHIDSSKHKRKESPEQVLAHLEARAIAGKFVSIGEVRDVLRRAAGLLCQTTKDQPTIIQHFVGIPFIIFTKQSIKLGISLWMGVINENPRVATRILSQIAQNWEMTVKRKQGLFSTKFTAPEAFNSKMEYAPSDKGQHNKHHTAAVNLLSPHLRLLQFLSSHFHASRHGSPNVLCIFHRIVRVTLEGLKDASGHPLAREVRFQFILFSLQVLKHSPGIMSVNLQWKMKDQILSAALHWFTFAPRWSFGGSRLQLKAEAAIMKDVTSTLQSIAHVGHPTLKAMESKQELLFLLLENEQARVATWLNPLDPSKKNGPGHTVRNVSEVMVATMLQTAWNENPALAVQMPGRFPGRRYDVELRKLLMNYPEEVVHIPEALMLLLGDRVPSDVNFQLKYLLFWAPVSPITAATYFLPSYANNPFILQYAMRALESHSVDITFFYVPQIVQTLRYDSLGYVERYILETAKFSQLFAHQIIWNMKANAYKDEESEIPDPVKPTLDKVMDHLINSFSPPDRSFYEREFDFFGEVTAISGKLRPFLKSTKAEKKQKIEEELRKIKVDVGVYLPSNPDGVVIGIDRKSGKPLQSHAKAPYMATFRVRRKRASTITSEELPAKGTERGEAPQGEEMWQSAIFKVGDDCRQDMLALQLISAFRSIFNNVGLDVYVYPYRVTATAPGCGVIDVLPNSISRDMLGREAVNGLYDYFIVKHGGVDSIKFQEARSNFVQSMAAYSVISYLLQFKDRHNGNIMIDDAGHILHIDFGFCFDIAPGGITFERAPFKLTAEMIAVMGGGLESQSYKWFEELCVKSFLACRAYSEQLVHCVVLMLDSGLPCFKPETIQNFRDRFVLDRNEREAADYMRSLVKKSYSSYTTKGYDQFQLLTNGIPY